MADETVAVSFVFGHVADLFLAVAEVFLLYKAIQTWTLFMTDIKEYKLCNINKIPKFGPVRISIDDYCDEYHYENWTFYPNCQFVDGKKYSQIVSWTATNGQGCSIELGPDGGGRFVLPRMP